jgi:hypothetical protein
VLFGGLLRLAQGSHRCLSMHDIWGLGTGAAEAYIFALRDVSDAERGTAFDTRSSHLEAARHLRIGRCT